MPGSLIKCGGEPPNVSQSIGRIIDSHFTIYQSVPKYKGTLGSILMLKMSSYFGTEW